LGVALGLAVGVALAARLPLLAILARGAVVLPFTGWFALLAWFQGQPERAAALIAKAWVSAVFAVLLAALTPMERLLAGLEALGAPPLMVSVVQFVWRYLRVAIDQLRRMQIARLVRGGERRFAFATSTVAVLFASSATRAERIHRAWLARGGEARFPLLDPPRWVRADSAFAGLALAAAAVVGLCGGWLGGWR
jgi:cobalt/nickel transport system permease protein